MKETVSIETQMAANQKRHITQVINAYSKRLLSFIRPRVKSNADAEDILQDVFFQFIDNTTPIEQLTSWLFRVTRNKIIDQQRKYHPDLLEDIYNDEEDEEYFDWREIFFAENDNPERQLLNNMFWEELQRALDQLPASQKDVFILNELEGVPFKVIAERTGETINTLISRKRYAVLHLRERLQVLHDELLNY